MAINIGMSWYDPTSVRTLREKVERAATFYKDKYGVAANVCFVHPGVLGTGEENFGTIAVRPSRTVLIDHLWLGVEKTTEPLKAPPLPRRRK